MKPLRWFDHISINLFWLGLNIRNTAVGSVFMPYLVDVFVRPEVRNTALGFMRTAGLIVALLVQPAMGLLSDRSTSRYGRRRPFLLVGVVFDLVFLAAIGISRSYWALFLAVLLLQVSSNVSHGPLQGLIPDLVPENQRGRASGVKAFFELVPLVLIAFTVAKLVADRQLGWAIVLTGAALLVTLVLTLVLVKEQPLREKPASSIRGPMARVVGILGGILAGGAAGLLAGGLVGGLVGLATWAIAGTAAGKALGLGVGGLVAMGVAVVVGVWGGATATLGADARRNAPFTWWIVNRLLFLAAATSIQGFAPYFLMSAFGLTREAAIDLNASLMLVVGLLTLLAALPGGWLADRLGSRRLTGISGLVATGGTLLLLVTALVPNLTLMYVAGSVIGLGAGLFMTTNWALGTELAPRQESGRYLGISNLAGAGAGMIGAGIGGPVADLISGIRPGLGYVALFGAYAVLFFLSTVSLRGVRLAAVNAGATEAAAPAGG
jgi:Na+/melibiose symporter-like transporter